MQKPTEKPLKVKSLSKEKGRWRKGRWAKGRWGKGRWGKGDRKKGARREKRKEMVERWEEWLRETKENCWLEKGHLRLTTVIPCSIFLCLIFSNSAFLASDLIWLLLITPTRAHSQVGEPSSDGGDSIDSRKKGGSGATNEWGMHVTHFLNHMLHVQAY